MQGVRLRLHVVVDGEGNLDLHLLVLAVQVQSLAPDPYGALPLVNLATASGPRRSRAD